MIPPFVISLDLEIDIHGEPTEERKPPDGLATGDRPDELPGLSQGVITPSSQTAAALMRVAAAWMDLVVRPSQLVGAFDHAVR